MITNLSIGRYGRFGNMLFQVAAVIGIARRSRQKFGFRQLINYDHYEKFNSSEDPNIFKYFLNPLPSLEGSPSEFIERPYAWGFHDIYLPVGNWNITGHFQSEKYFADAIEEVRHYMTMIGEVDQDKYRNKVAIHVRRGDYDDKYHTRIGVDYYQKAINQFPEFQEFVVFSDDIEAAHEMLGWDDLVEYREDTDYLSDFLIMKQCGGFITANSSYSLMAAILSDNPDKKIVCPSQWFGPAWTPDTKDLYPKNAIII